VIVGLIAGLVVVGLELPALGTVIMLVAFTGAIYVGVRGDYRRAQRLIDSSPHLHPPEGMPPPRPAADIEQRIAAADSTPVRARIPDAARRPDGQPLEAFFVPTSRAVAGFLGVAAVFTAITIYVGFAATRWVAAIGLVTIGLIILALSVAFRVMASSSTGIYDRTGPATDTSYGLTRSTASASSSATTRAAGPDSSCVPATMRSASPGSSSPVRRSSH